MHKRHRYHEALEHINRWSPHYKLQLKFSIVFPTVNTNTQPLVVHWCFFFGSSLSLRVLISSQNLLTLLIEISNWMSCLPAINHFVNIRKCHIWARVAFALKSFSYNMPFALFFSFSVLQQPYTFYIKRTTVIPLNVHCNWNKNWM